MKLSDYIGSEIIVMIRVIDPALFQKVVLKGVETGGIWIESNALTTIMLRSLKQATLPVTPQFFFPYHEITFAIVKGGEVALDEEAFGL
ncbi:MAG: hypothetical protein ABSG51_06205 [Terracidiphilus sp.]